MPVFAVPDERGQEKNARKLLMDDVSHFSRARHPMNDGGYPPLTPTLYSMAMMPVCSSTLTFTVL